MADKKLNSVDIKGSIENPDYILIHNVTTGKIEQVLKTNATVNPINHASNHTDGTDDIQDATNSQKGLATAAQITTLEAATLNTDTDVSGNSWVLDEDDMASDDNTKVPTQQSVKKYVDDSMGSVGTGGLQYNYIANPNAENDLAGWATSDGTNFPLTRATAVGERISGTASFKAAKDANNQQNDYISYAFSISDNMKNDVKMEINFLYYITGSYSNGDLECKVYDVDNVQYIDFQTLTDIKNQGDPSQFHSYFLTTTSSNYELRINIKTTSTSSYSILFDDVRIVKSEGEGYETESRTINLPTSLSTANQQKYINLAGKNLINSAVLTWQFGDGTHSTTQTLQFTGFRGNGQMYIYGNNSDSFRSNTKTVKLDVGGQYYGLRITRCAIPVKVRYLQIQIQFSYSANYALLYVLDSSDVETLYNAVYETSGTPFADSASIRFIQSKGMVRETNVGGVYYGIESGHGAHILSQANGDYTTAASSAGLKAWSGGEIAKYSATQPTGESTTNGGEIR